MQYKHKCDYTIIYEGKRYKSIMGIVTLPVELKAFNPIKEKKAKKESKED